MISSYLRSFRFPAETVALAALMFFLPLLEAPKNLAWLAWVVLWLVNRIRCRDFGGRWDAWDTLIFAWIASGYLVAAFSGIHHHEWSGANDILRYGAVLWLLKRSGYGEREFRLVIVTLILTTVVGLPVAYWQWLVSHRRNYLELNSVGAVNHTGIYLDIVLGMAVSAVLAYWRSLSPALRAGSLLIVFVLAVSVLETASRAAIGMALGLAVMLGIAWTARSRIIPVVMIAIVAATVAFAFLARLEVVKKQESNVEGDNVLAFRGQIWRTAIVAWERFPVFGVGMDNYNQITKERVQEWLDRDGKAYEAGRYLPSAHGHSLYMNTLAERGTFGALILLAVLAAWIASLARHRPGAGEGDLAWTLWGGALSAWIISVGTGFGNTSLHHEHAILAVTLLGLWLAHARKRPA